MNETSIQRWKERALYVGGYVSFFWTAFFLAAYFTFPYDRVRDSIMSRMNGSDGGLELRIGELSPSWFTGVQVDDVDLVRAAVGDETPAKLHLDTATVRVSPFALLVGATKASFEAEVGSGTIEASYSGTEEVQQIDAELTAVDVRTLGLGGFIGVPLKGSATGTVNLMLDADPTKSAGDIALSIEGLRLGDGKTKIKIPGMAGGLTIEEIHAGTLELTTNLHDGVAEFQKLTSNGKDVEIDGSGAARLANPLRNTRLDVSLELKVNDGYKNKTPQTKAMFEMLGFSPWGRSMGTDGVLKLHVTGPVQALRATPGSTGRAARGSKKRADKAIAAPAR